MLQDQIRRSIRDGSIVLRGFQTCPEAINFGFFLVTLMRDNASDNALRQCPPTMASKLVPKLLPKLLPTLLRTLVFAREVSNFLSNVGSNVGSNFGSIVA